MIEKRIHQIWMSDNEKPEIMKNCIETVKSLGWQYDMWSGKQLIDMYGQELFDKVSTYNPSFQSDIYRVLLVKDFGGFYLDGDVEVFEDFSHLCDTDFVCNISFYNVQNITIMNEFFGSVPNGRMITKIVDKALSLVGLLPHDVWSVMRSFGHVVTNHLGIKENVISTSEYNKYLKHHFAHSWKHI